MKCVKCEKEEGIVYFLYGPGGFCKKCAEPYVKRGVFSFAPYISHITSKEDNENE